jgi:hypothetical protein
MLKRICYKYVLISVRLLHFALVCVTAFWLAIAVTTCAGEV